MEEAVKRAIHNDEAKEKKRVRKISRGVSSTATTPPTTGFPSPAISRRGSFADIPNAEVAVNIDEEKGEVVVKRKWWHFGKKKVEEEHEKIKPGWRDVNPFPTMLIIFRKPTNAVVLFASGAYTFLCYVDLEYAQINRYLICGPIHHCLYRINHPRCRSLQLQFPEHRSRHSQFRCRKYGRFYRRRKIQ